MAVETRWSVLALSVAVLLALPLLAVGYIALSGGDNVWPHLATTVLPAALRNTLLLMLGTGALSLVIGTGTAWIVTMHRFPGRDLADRLLVLPLAMPTYIVAYAYVDLLDFAGPVQTGLRGLFGDHARVAMTVFDLRSLQGAIGIFSAVLYPYVYLTARASFEQQSVCVLEVARTLGRTSRQAFWSVALPLARPALVAGCTLVLMESLNDLGAVQYLGVETMSASIFATWMQRGNLPGAAQLALVMLALIAAIMAAERSLRGRGGVQATTGRYRAIPFETLSGVRAWMALALVLAPALFGFIVPFTVLAVQAVQHIPALDLAAYLSAARNSLTLAAMTSVVAIALALVLAYAARITQTRVTLAASRFAGFGYALPGTVLAIGLMQPLASLDNVVDAWMRGTTGLSTGLLLSGSLFAVTAALVIRFLAVAIGTVETGLERISPNIDAAARTLGAGTWGTLRQIHLPILLPALGAAGLLVFVDTMKELPATLLLRPFNFETLATSVYGLTSAERFEEAALGAITIVIAGVVPLLWLHRAVSEGRSGRSGSKAG